MVAAFSGKRVTVGWQVSAFQIGDEGHLSEYKDGERFEIAFRRGSVVAMIATNSLAAVKEFAECVVEQLPRNLVRATQAKTSAGAW